MSDDETLFAFSFAVAKCLSPIALDLVLIGNNDVRYSASPFGITL
jgi:hypothetical protein